jgi:transcriptional regulator with XRE-family HTH domain
VAQEPPSYGDVADALADLPTAIRVTRRVRRLSAREVARQAGVSFSLVIRVEQGHACNSANVIRLLRWLDAPARPAGRDETGQ